MNFVLCYLPFKGWAMKIPDPKFIKNDFTLSNMAGPKKPWKFFGGELQNFLIAGRMDSMLQFTTVGDNARLGITYNVGLRDAEKHKIFIEAVEKKLKE
jgi:hypothetical protein